MSIKDFFRRKRTDPLPEDDVFVIEARRCKRCGGLLTSREAIRDGYGHTCKMKVNADIEERRPEPGQINIMDLLNETFNAGDRENE